MRKGPRTAPRHLTSRPAQAVTGAAMQEACSLYASGRLADAEPVCRSILAQQADHSGALGLLGIIQARTGRLHEAEDLLGRAAARMPHDPAAHHNHGNVLRDLGRPLQALACYDRALALNPDYADAHYNRAAMLFALGRFADALAGYERVLALRSDNAAAWNSRGTALFQLARYEEAAESYGRALMLEPSHAAALNNRGAALSKLRLPGRALKDHDRALAIQPQFAKAHNNRGIALRALGDLDAALASYDRAIAITPDYAEAHNNRGDALRGLGQPQAALASYDRAIALKPDYPEAHNNRAEVLRELKDFEGALASCQRALTLKPDFAEALLNQGAILYDQRRFAEALACYERAIALQPDNPTAYRTGALVQYELGRPDDALASYRRAYELDPDDPYLYGTYLHARLRACDWRGIEAELARLAVAIESGKRVATPFVALSVADDPGLHRKAASTWIRAECNPRQKLPPIGRYPKHRKIRLGYFSADFRNHAVSLLAAELFELHDRSRFEVSAFSLGPDIRDELRERVAPVFDRFISVPDKPDEDVAALARDMQIDIAIDLGGYTQGARPGIFAQRAAPIQVSYLGYLGTLASDCMDYLIADDVIVPAGLRRHYVERIAYLPCYQVNDRKRPLPERVFARAELGLPPDGFVFCCFNASYKITPRTFATWMRILAAVPGSTLLLYGESAEVIGNLRAQASDHRMDPQRLVFAPKVIYADYLARYLAADLFLDTHPYNAGTTASDALWMGLPVLTYPGEAFAARMAASLLTAVGLPELIAPDPAGYEQLAIQLARDAARMAALRRKLAAARVTAPLFHTPAFTRSLEGLFERMYERHHLGLLPEHLSSHEPLLAVESSPQ